MEVLRPVESRPVDRDMLAIRRHLELKVSGFSGMGAGCSPTGMVSQNDAGSEENVRSALHEDVAFDIVQVRHEVAQVANVGNLGCEEFAGAP